MFKKVILIISLLVFAISCSNQKPTRPNLSESDSNNGQEDVTKETITIITPEITLDGVKGTSWKIEVEGNKVIETAKLEKIWKAIVADKVLANSPTFTMNVFNTTAKDEQLRARFDDKLNIVTELNRDALLDFTYKGVAILKVPSTGGIKGEALDGQYVVAGIYRSADKHNSFYLGDHIATQTAYGDQYVVFRNDGANVQKGRIHKGETFYGAQFIYYTVNRREFTPNVVDEETYKISQFRYATLKQGWYFVNKSIYNK